MATHLMQRLEAERLRRFEGLAGSRVDTVLPLRQELVDAVLAQVPRWPAPLEDLSLRIAAGRMVHVAAAIRVFGFRTRVRLRLQLAPAVENGRVRLFLDRSLLSGAISWLGPLVGGLPAGVALEGNEIIVDLAQFAARKGLGDLADLLSAASFETDEGVLWINARAEVPPVPVPGDGTPEGPTAPAPAPIGANEPGSSAARLPFTPDQLVAWMRGARVDADVRLTQRLANELLAAAHADAHRAAAGDARPAATLARSLRPPALRFEDGALRLAVGADLRDQTDATTREPRNA